VYRIPLQTESASVDLATEPRIPYALWGPGPNLAMHGLQNKVTKEQRSCLIHWSAFRCWGCEIIYSSSWWWPITGWGLDLDKRTSHYCWSQASDKSYWLPDYTP